MWKIIKRIGHTYEVNEQGQIRNSNTGKTLALNERCGYLGVTIAPEGRQGKAVRLRVHRCVAEAFVDGWFEGAVVNHKDGDKLNNKSGNLEWVTYSENSRHAINLGLAPGRKGKQNKSSYLTDVQIEEIKISKLTQRELAFFYKVSKTKIHRIKASVTE